jgi:hypothetical protein
VAGLEVLLERGEGGLDIDFGVLAGGLELVDATLAPEQPDAVLDAGVDGGW